MKSKSFYIVILAALAVPFFLYCIYPVYDGNEKFLEEQQSVWQYLNVYSIYQERLPDECGGYTPNDLFDMIHDTLKRGRYTGYRPLSKKIGGGLSALPANGDTMLEVTDSTAYIRISGFWPDPLKHFQDWRARLANFQNIVIDVRNNGGGYLFVSDSIIGEFIPRNSGFIKTRYRKYDERNCRGETFEWADRKNEVASPRLTGKKVSVLMNGGSASASEILISALKDRAKANLVGTKTYGKGIGQVIIPRTGRDSLSITFMQIKGVSNRTGSYHEKGIEPDAIPEKYRREAPDSCDVDTFFYYAVKMLEPSAPGVDILHAARTINGSNEMRNEEQTAGPVGVYVVTEPDPLK